MKGAADRRVLRGGSFNNNEENVRCAYRNHNQPNNRNNNNGFRVSCVRLTSLRCATRNTVHHGHMLTVEGLRDGAVDVLAALYR